MSYQSLVFLVILTVTILPNPSSSEQVRHPSIHFDIGGHNPKFRAGDSVTVKVQVSVGFQPDSDKKYFRPDVIINEESGDSIFITGLEYQLGPDTKNWKIVFIPIMTGQFNMLFRQDRFKISDTISYQVTPGPIFEFGSMLSWMDPNHMNWVVEKKTTVLILPKDAFGNNVTSQSEGHKVYDFVISVIDKNGKNANLPQMSFKGWNNFGYLYFEFVSLTAGNLSVHVTHKNRHLINSPLPLTVHPEALDVENCYPHWNFKKNYFQVFSRMEFMLDQRDKFNNLVPGLYDFNIELVKEGSWGKLPISDLQYKEVYPGIQSISFRLSEPGDFILMISNATERKMVIDTPYHFKVYVGYCSAVSSYITGPGLNDSRAGEVAKFSVFLKDDYTNPALVELDRMEVQIIEPKLSIRISPEIYVKNPVKGTLSSEMLGYGAERTSVPSVYSRKNSIRTSNTLSNEFEVVFTPTKSGVYEVYTYCGNIVLNGSDNHIKQVSAGAVNISLSEVITIPPKVVSTYVEYDIVVRLFDSYYNPVLSEKNSIHVVKLKGSPFFPCGFEDNNNGTYKGCFLTMNPGKLDLCVEYDGKRLSPCPFVVVANPNKYYPSLRYDNAMCWEDQSTLIDVLDNDYVHGKTPTFTEYQTANHGSVLLYGSRFRYTPFKGFYGPDQFQYTLTDEQGITLSSIAFIDVVPIPPEFISPPKHLHGIEDSLTPTYGGYSGLALVYTEALDNISVHIRAKKGTVFLSPISIELWDPMWNEILVNKVEGEKEFLNLTGRLEVINFAMNFLQYTGAKNFSGTDIIMFSTLNQHGKKDFDIEIIVEPINDPPVINVPEFILLEYEKIGEGLLIFNSKRDKFNFSVEDPDYPHFPGDKSNFQVMFSVEVSSGSLSAVLPVKLTNTTELKLEDSKQWQPLQAFVAISNQISVNKTKGIRFLGTLDDCNTLLRQLVYYGDEDGGVLKVSVNDMGWHGCYPDCTESVSVPLISEAMVKLITKTPMNSMVAHILGTGIVIESIIISILAVTLMWFMCKSVIALILVFKNCRGQSQNLQDNEFQDIPEEMSRANSSNSAEDNIQLTETSSPISQSGQPPDLSNP